MEILSIFDFAFLDKICNVCTELMKIMTYTWGNSYGVLNTLLFVILGPLAIVCGFVATLLSYFKQRKVSIGFLIAGAVMTFVIGFMIFTTMLDALFPQFGLTNEMLNDAAHISGYEGTSLMDKICYDTIALLESMSRCLHIPYGPLNTILYVFIGPISTIFFFISALFSYFNKRIVSYIFFTLASIMIAIVILMIIITTIHIM